MPADHVQIVSRESATLGLSGERETVLRMEANHSDICRFDLDDPRDQRNFELLVVNMAGLCEDVVKTGEEFHRPPLPRRQCR